jgi:hypothetical protein
MPRRIYVDGDRWMAADAQLVMDQSVMTFPNVAALKAAIPNPTDGMTAWLADATMLLTYNGQHGRWVSEPRTFVTGASAIADNTTIGRFAFPWVRGSVKGVLVESFQCAWYVQSPNGIDAYWECQAAMVPVAGASVNVGTISSREAGTDGWANYEEVRAVYWPEGRDVGAIFQVDLVKINAPGTCFWAVSLHWRYAE